MAEVRLTRQARREQLLDVAADLLVESGGSGLTMEGLAARAGVTKGLPYVHFDNADAVIDALHQREIGLLSDAVAAAYTRAHDPEERLRACLHAYFGVIIERGAVLSVLITQSAWPARAGAELEERRRFVARLFRVDLGLPRVEAELAASIFLGALNGGVEALALRQGARRVIEDRLVGLALGFVEAARARAR